ncbi:MAG: hypothetical protein HZB99_03495 [Candidatus Harrisonbacteria bacterium]|nr:hypothetical protein [Candidatus Harrisonbacteria bacterium]
MKKLASEMARAELIITSKINNGGIRKKLWDLYNAVFAGQEKISVQNQKCYTEETFQAALLDEEYIKFYLILDDEVVAYMLATNNLQKAAVTYMNPERYRELFPEYAAANKIYYFTSLGVHPEQQKQKLFYQIISAGFRRIAELRGMYAFDFSQESVANLAGMFIRIAHRLHQEGLLPEMKYVKVGAQEFGAIAPTHPQS